MVVGSNFLNKPRVVRMELFQEKVSLVFPLSAQNLDDSAATVQMPFPGSGGERFTVSQSLPFSCSCQR